MTNHFIFSSIFFCFFITVIVRVSRAADSGRCPGGYTDGTRVDIGRYWYECRHGRVEPKGCLDDQGGRVDLLETYDVKGFRMQCLLNDDGYLAVIYKSCLDGGQREHAVGDRWNDGEVAYACKKDGAFLRVEKVGCVVEGGRRVDIDEKIVNNNDHFVYQCKKNQAGQPKLAPWGCADKNGKQYAVGDTFESDDFWYSCFSTTDTPNGELKLSVKCVGCMHEQRRFKDGDRFYRDDVFFECAVNGDKTRFRPAGCVQRYQGKEIERRLGCFWVEGQAPYEYEMTCKLDSDGKKAVKRVNKCNYKVEKGTVDVQPGCYRIIDSSTAVACLKASSSGNDDVRMMILSVGGDGRLITTPPGLRAC